MEKGKLLFKEDINKTNMSRKLIKWEIKILIFIYLITSLIIAYFEIFYYNRNNYSDALGGLSALVIGIFIFGTYFWIKWPVALQIFENGINYPMGGETILFLIRNRYIFIPYNAIKAIMFTEKKESYLDSSKDIYTMFAMTFLIFEDKIRDKNKDIAYDFEIDKKIKSGFGLNFIQAREVIQILKKVLGEKKWKELSNKPELFKELPKKLQEELSLNGHWEPKEDIPT